MSWAKLLADKRVTALPSSKAELDNLRSIVARSLKDVESAGLSADARFVMAYDAARTLSLLVVRATGYRPRTVGAHYNTFFWRWRWPIRHLRRCLSISMVAG
jgi:hypothetical protein